MLLMRNVCIIIVVAQNKQIAPVSESSLRVEPGAGTASSLKLHAEDLQTGCCYEI
jgi:hypothetical protein